MEKQSIIVSGKNGQLGNELAELSALFPNFHFVFAGHAELDISDNTAVENIFATYHPSWFVNAAAYTAVDKAEADQEQAFKVNAEAAGIIAANCNKFHTRLIHISTDYVFDGNGDKPYHEEDGTNPVNYYGYTKWMGEQLALQNNPETVVIRTSWVYSKFGNNFVKTMIRLMKERPQINVVSDQFGSPTWAKDLAATILNIIERSATNANLFQPGVYHYSNEGKISWFDFASAIRDLMKFECVINPIPTSQFPTSAKRPSWSVMSKEKISSTFDLDVPEWHQSLVKCIAEL